MKKIILSLAFAAAVLTTGTAMASAEKKPTYAVTQSFKQEFSNIKEVKWESLKEDAIFLANFTFNNEILQAYFTAEGEFLGTTRQITKSQLPILVVKALDKKYADAKLVTVFEHSMNDGLAYYITVSDKKGVVILKATGNGQLTVHQRQKQ